MDAIHSHQSPIMLDPSEWKSMLQMDHMSDSRKLEITATEFESTLVRQFLKDAMKPVIQGGAISEDGVAQDIYRGYFTDVLAQTLSKGEGIGISSALQSQLSTNLKTKETDAS